MDPQARLKAQLKMAVNRLKLLQQKKTALAKQSRREIAKVLENNKVESARIRIENIIQDDIHVELLEILEVYCELLMARIMMLHDPDERVQEAVQVIIHAAPFTEVKELQNVRVLLLQRLPQGLEVSESNVPQKVYNKVHVKVPSEELVTLYLTEIAKAYKVSVPGIYEPEPEPESTEPADASQSTKAKSNDGEDEKSKDKGGSDDTTRDDLWTRFAALKKPGT